MPTTCSVKGCMNRRGGGLHYFRVPANPRISEHWYDFLEQSGVVINRRSDYRICENHFETQLIKRHEKTNVRKVDLTKGAVPTILDG